jgi:hypothetical protein
MAPTLPVVALADPDDRVRFHDGVMVLGWKSSLKP